MEPSEAYRPPRSRAVLGAARRGLLTLAAMGAALSPAMADPRQGAYPAPSASYAAVLPEGAIASSGSVDWVLGAIRVEASLDLAKAGVRLPSGRYEAESLLAGALPDIVRGLALGITVDSYRSVDDTLLDGSLDAAAFERFLESGSKERMALNRELTRLEAAYEWRLSDLTSLYVRHSEPLDMAAPDRYAPTRAYSGIVIYVKGRLPVRGEHRDAPLEPCLFPRIYDESMRAILDRNLASPEALRAWGPLAYASSLEAIAVAARAGGDPLRIIATQVFGSRRTDVIVSAEDARRILGSEANRELVRRGRVVLVLDAP